MKKSIVYVAAMAAMFLTACCGQNKCNCDCEACQNCVEKQDPNAPKEENQKLVEESLPVGESILDTPLHDTGNKLLAILSFFLPLLGLLAGFVFRKFNHIRNYKMCKKGAIAGLLTLGAIVLFFCLMLVVSVL